MDILKIIEDKKNGKVLTKAEINYVITGYLKNEIADYQISALLMAILLKGMDEQETIYLTDAMLNSGDKMDLSQIVGVKVDKHSTGGVGDKTSLIVAPLVASCGVKVAKMSGRGLGHTGGTIDKLEAIPNFKVELTNKEFLDQVNKVGMAIVSQTGNLVPADKKLYALRDVTGTVSSIPLIASSIMSKKLASGADYIVIDVKVGKGALVKTKKEALELAKIMSSIGNYYHKKTVCVLSNMNYPLGKAIGNALEVVEAVDVLLGKGPKDITELSVTIASVMVSLAKNINYQAAKVLVQEKLNSHEAYYKFLEFVDAQHGNLQNLEVSNKVYSIKSTKTGWIKKIDALKLGELAKRIGAGRMTKDEKIDLKVGFLLNKQVGDYVLENEELTKVFLGEKNVQVEEILDCFTITNSLGELEPLVYKIIE